MLSIAKNQAPLQGLKLEKRAGTSHIGGSWPRLVNETKMEQQSPTTRTRRPCSVLQHMHVTITGVWVDLGGKPEPNSRCKVEEDGKTPSLGLF